MKTKRTAQAAQIKRIEKAIGELYAVFQILAKKIEVLEQDKIQRQVDNKTTEEDA